MKRERVSRVIPLEGPPEFLEDQISVTDLDAAPVISVILPARNAAATIEAQLEALSHQTFEHVWELIVVDNGSSDSTRRLVDEFDRALNVRALECSRPGVNAARNVGLSAASGKYVVFCDADDVVDNDWLTQMHAALQTGVLVAGRIDAISLNSEMDGPVPHRPDGPVPVAGFLSRGITANLGIWREVAEAVGGFNEAYTFGATDTEFCWRVQLAGHRLCYAPAAVVAWRRANDERTVFRKAFLTGRARVRLFKDFRDQGMPRSNPSRAVLHWLRLLLAVPLSVPRARRREWLRDVAASLGRLAGSLEFRVLYL